MPFRFYRRFRAGPFRLNFSKSGMSYSFGGHRVDNPRVTPVPWPLVSLARSKRGNTRPIGAKRLCVAGYPCAGRWLSTRPAGSGIRKNPFAAPLPPEFCNPPSQDDVPQRAVPAIMRTQRKARFCRAFLPHTSLAAHRDAPVICANPSCGRRMKRRSRQQKYCSDRCGQMARHWRQSPVLTPDSRRDRNPQKKIIVSVGCAGNAKCYGPWP
jgi:hypothetical protein